MKERRAYVVLVAISIILSVLTFLLGARHVNNNNKKFCQLITASLNSVNGSVAKPTDPTANPKQEKLYENYIIVRDLGRSLGCAYNYVIDDK